MAFDQGFPGDGVEVTLLLVVRYLERSRRFIETYWVRPKPASTVALRPSSGSREPGKLPITGGGPTLDKPTVTLAPPASTDIVSHELTIRVTDCRAAYETLKRRGATTLTPPVEYDWEVRCFFRDPGGNLLEISRSKASLTQA